MCARCVTNLRLLVSVSFLFETLFIDLLCFCMSGAALCEPALRPCPYFCWGEAWLPERPAGDPLRLIQPHFRPLGLHLVPEEPAAKGLREAEEDGGSGERQSWWHRRLGGRSTLPPVYKQQWHQLRVITHSQLQERRGNPGVHQE